MAVRPNVRFEPLPGWMSAAWLTVVPLIAAIAAFQQSAQQHVLDSLFARSMCGNLAMRAGAPEFLGHCAACWSAAASAGLGTLAVMLVLTHAARLTPVMVRK